MTQTTQSVRRRLSWKTPALPQALGAAGILLSVMSSAASAQSPPVAASPAHDTVVLAPRSEGAGRIILTGKILDYTGAALTLEATGGKQTLPGKQVVEVRSTWTAQQTAGDDLWRRREYASAYTKYAEAFAADERRWARRLIQSRIVACLREQERWEQAAEAFLQLVRDDPATPYFAVIPLPWTVVAAGPALEAKARVWAGDRTSSVAALLGATYLSATSSRTEALRRLRELSLDGDPRIALLAEAQLWRTAAVTADAATVENWQHLLDKIPDALQAGPTLIVGRAWAQRNEPERAALVLLRIPILYPDEHRTAAEALWSAGQMLERLAQPQQAATLYQEILREFPKALVAGQAADRLKELAPTP